MNGGMNVRERGFFQALRSRFKCYCSLRAASVARGAEFSSSPKQPRPGLIVCHQLAPLFVRFSARAAIAFSQRCLEWALTQWRFVRHFVAVFAGSRGIKQLPHNPLHPSQTPTMEPTIAPSIVATKRKAAGSRSKRVNPSIESLTLGGVTPAACHILQYCSEFVVADRSSHGFTVHLDFRNQTALTFT
jgi:hypothetical protein